jgi:hypothetical protein
VVCRAAMARWKAARALKVSMKVEAQDTDTAEMNVVYVVYE